MIARINCLRNLSLSMLLLASSMAASAQDNTEELLTAPRVRRFLAIGPTSADGETMICRDVLPDRLSLDPVGGCKRVAAKTPFAFISSTRDQIQVLRPEFNPLRELLVVTSSVAPETATAELPGYDGVFKATNSFLKTIEKTPFGASEKADDNPCRAPKGMPDHLLCLDRLRAMAQPSLTSWAAKTNGLAGIGEIRMELRSLSKQLQDNIERAEELRNTLLKPQSGLDREAQDTQALAALTAITAAAEPLVRAKGLAAELKGLDGVLKAFDDPARWVGNSLLVHSIDADLDEIQIRKIGISDTKWTYSDDEGLSHETKEISPVTLRARAARRLVPEVSLAVVHTRLARSVYGAVEENGRLVVRQGKDEGVDIKPGALLNFVCRCFGDTSLYPMLQVGTTEVDSAPAVLVGGGLRLFGKTPLAISAGGIVAWMRDLNNLKPGDVVKSALEVDADLKRRMQIRLYVALQYKF